MKQGSESSRPFGEGDDDIRPATAEMRRRGLFGRKVRLLREGLHMTPDEFGTQFGFAPDDVSAWERGRRMPDVATVMRIDEIVGRSRDMQTVARA